MKETILTPKEKAFIKGWLRFMLAQTEELSKITEMINAARKAERRSPLSEQDVLDAYFEPHPAPAQKSKA